MDYSKEEFSSLQKFIDTYQKTKALILYSEGVDPNFNSDIQPIKELRDALDHVVRILAFKYGEGVKNRKKDMVIDNFEKAIGHVYRAAFDALDGTVMSLETEIVKKLNSYPVEVVIKIFPDYYQIKQKLFSTQEKVATLRGSKDVSEDVSKVFESYFLEVEYIKAFYKEVLDKSHALDACHNDLKESERKADEKIKAEHEAQSWIQTKSAIIGGLIVAAVIAAFNFVYKNIDMITAWLEKWKSS